MESFSWHSLSFLYWRSRDEVLCVAHKVIFWYEQCLSMCAVVTFAVPSFRFHSSTFPFSSTQFLLPAKSRDAMKKGKWHHSPARQLQRDRERKCHWNETSQKESEEKSMMMIMMMCVSYVKWVSIYICNRYVGDERRCDVEVINKNGKIK